MHSFIRCSRTQLAALGVALAALLAAPLHARGQGSSSTSYSIGAYAGLAVPVSDLSNYTSSGYSIAATLGMHQSLSPLTFRAEGSFTELPWSDNSGVKHRIYGFAFNGIYNLGTASTNGGLYLTGGAGYYGARDTGGFIDTGTDWNFGLNGGLGYYLPLSGFTVYFEGRYVHVFSNPAQGMFPITVGITF